MSISGIGGGLCNVNYYNNKGSRNSNQVAGSFNTESCINLKMTDEDSENKALTCVGFPDGRSVSVFKADGHTDSNPEYMVKYWDENGEETEYIVNPTQVNPENASYFEMLSYSTYLDVTGQTKDAFGHFLSASRGVNGDLEYNTERMNERINYKSLVKEFMEMQYEAGNLSGYLEFKRFYDCMGTSPSAPSGNGKVLGLTTIGSKGYVAVYADSSTEENPIIKVGDYEIRIKDVDPRNATKMEMFALLSYMDDKGLTKNQGMKSFHKMTAYSMQAEYNGYFNGLSDENAAWATRRNWIGILENAKETFLSMPQTYEQGLNCQTLYESLKEWLEIGTGRDNLFGAY